MNTNTQPCGVGSVDQTLRREVLDHSVDRIAETALNTDPFPHLLVTGLFPSEVYKDLIESFPDQSQYEPFAYEKHHGDSGAPNRYRYQFSNESLNALSVNRKNLWYTLRSVLGSIEFKRVVYAKLAPGLMLRYNVKRPQVEQLPGYALPELFRETEGYSIKPHPDTRKKVVTMQIALAISEHQRELGTEFYRRSVAPRTWMRSPIGFEVVKKMPFTPNTMYAFSVLNTIKLKSWHGRTAISGDYGTRNSILNIWYEDPKHANQDLIDDCEWFAANDPQLATRAA